MLILINVSELGSFIFHIITVLLQYTCKVAALIVKNVLYMYKNLNIIIITSPLINQ